MKDSKAKFIPQSQVLFYLNDRLCSWQVVIDDTAFRKRMEISKCRPFLLNFFFT